MTIAILLSLGLAQVFLPRLWSGFGHIDWLLIYAVLQSLRLPFRRSILIGAAAGLIQDGLSGGIIGLHAFAKTTVTAIISTFGGLLVVRGPVTEAGIVALTTLLEGFLVVGWQTMLGQPLSLGAADLLIRAVATGIATLLILAFCRRRAPWALRRQHGGRR